MHKVAVIGGDGIGPEVIAEALKVVAAAGVAIEQVDYDLGAAHYERTGEVLPDSVLEELQEAGRHPARRRRPADRLDGGAAGGPRARPAPEAAFRARPVHQPPPLQRGPGSIAPDADFVVVRENTEGPYVGEGGALRRGTPYEVATQGSVNTRHGVERCVRFAFELAERRRAPRLTLVHKTNVLTYSGDLWQRSSTRSPPSTRTSRPRTTTSTPPASSSSRTPPATTSS